MADHMVVLFENFRGGDFGSALPVEYGRMLRSGREAGAAIAHTGMWTGSDMTVLPDGSLCPMPVPAAKATSLPALAGTVVDMGMGYTSSGSVIWFKAGNKVYQSGGGPTYTFTAVSNTTVNTLSYIDRAVSNQFTFPISSTNVLEYIDHSGGGVGLVSGSPPSCSTVAQFNDRLMLGGAGSNANRLYFSAAGNFSSWPANNYIDVGGAAPIVALVPMRGFLAIAKGAGPDSTWWTLRGVPGVNAVLRPASRFPTPAAPNDVVVPNDGRAVFTTPFLTTDAGGSPAVPASFDGSTGQLVTTQDRLGGSANTEAYRLAGGNDVVFKQYNQMLMRHNGAWQLLAIASGLQANTSNFALKSRSMALDPAGSVFSMLNAAADTFYAWSPYTKRPAFVTDTTAQPGSGVFTLPEWRSPLGSEVSVTGVVVEFRKWDTGDTNNNNRFDVILSSTSPFGGGATTSVGTSIFSEVASVSSQLGTTARVNFSFAQQFGNGFILKFQNVRGVAIQTIAVFCESRGIQGLS